MNRQTSSRDLKVLHNRLLVAAFCIGGGISFPAAPFCDATSLVQQTQEAAPRRVAKRIGAIKAINGTEITLTPDSGPDLKITVQPATQIVRVAPGETNVNNATPIQLQDLQVGDRIRATGWASDDNLPLPVLKIVVMKRSDLEARHEQDLKDWQKRGVGGLVSAVNGAAGAVTISVVSFAGKKELVVHSSKTTVIRRYAADSVKFDDAKPSTLQEVRAGDQLRARGERNPDGTELSADEIVSGSFRNLAGTINSVDASASTLTVQDLLSKKTVLVKVTANSQLRHLPPEMAQRIAMRLKGTADGATAASGAASNPTPGQTPTPSASSRMPESGSPRGSGMGGGRSGGSPDFQQMLGRMPAASLADLHKGDAVMLVCTEGTAGTGTAITLLSGVDPILQAAPSASQAMMLSPWSLGAPSSDAGGP